VAYLRERREGEAVRDAEGGVTARTFIIKDDLQRQRLKQWLDRQDLPLQVDAGPVHEPRTNAQNDRLWKLHRAAAAFTGDIPEDLHEDRLCAFYGFTEKRMPSGYVKRIPLKRSSTRDKQEFRQFMDFVENFYASELGVWLGQEAA